MTVNTNIRYRIVAENALALYEGSERTKWAKIGATGGAVAGALGGAHRARENYASRDEGYRRAKDALHRAAKRVEDTSSTHSKLEYRDKNGNVRFRHMWTPKRIAANDSEESRRAKLDYSEKLKEARAARRQALKGSGKATAIGAVGGGLAGAAAGAYTGYARRAMIEYRKNHAKNS